MVVYSLYGARTHSIHLMYIYHIQFFNLYFVYVSRFIVFSNGEAKYFVFFFLLSINVFRSMFDYFLRNNRRIKLSPTLVYLFR